MGGGGYDVSCFALSYILAPQLVNVLLCVGLFYVRVKSVETVTVRKYSNRSEYRIVQFADHFNITSPTKLGSPLRRIYKH